MIWFLKENLWSHITKSSKWLATSFSWPKCLTQSKINKFDLWIVRRINHENILRLQVPMSDTEWMQVINGSCYLMSYLSCSFLWDFKIFEFKISKEISSFKVFHHDVNIVWIFKNIIKPNNVWVLTNLKYLNFSF